MKCWKFHETDLGQKVENDPLVLPEASVPPGYTCSMLDYSKLHSISLWIMSRAHHHVQVLKLLLVMKFVLKTQFAAPKEALPLLNNESLKYGAVKPT